MAFSKEKAHDRAEKYAARGQHDRAAREYQTIVEHDPKDVRAWLMLADSLARTGDRAGAVSRYQQVGDFYASGREYQKALAVYRQVLNLDPARLDIHYKCAQLNMEVGRVHDAIASFESIAQSQLSGGRVAEALQTYRTIADADPSVVSKRLRLAELYSRENMVADAVRAFRQAGQVLLDAGRHADFVRVAERLVYHKPDDRETVRALARVYLHLGDARHALMKLNGLLQGDPGDAAGLELLAETFMALGKPDKASSVIAELTRSLREVGDEAAAQRALDMGLDWIPGDRELLALRDAAGAAAASSRDRAGQGTPAPDPLGGMDPDDDMHDAHADVGGDIDFELDDADVVELDEADVVLADDGPGAGPGDSSAGIELDFGDLNDDPPSDAAASTSMTDHVLEEVSQGAARASLLQEAAEPVDPESLTDSDKLLFEARVYVKYRLFEHALEHMQPLLNEQPNHVAALSLKARSLSELERVEEAAATHARIAALVEGGDPKLAREHVHAALSAVPRHPEALAVQSRLESQTPPPMTPSGGIDLDLDLDVDLDVAADALDLVDDDISIDLSEPEPESEDEPDTSPIVIENRFGISEAGPLPEADSSQGLALSIAPTEQMQALKRARASADEGTPPAAFLPRPPAEPEHARRGGQEFVPTSVDIEALALRQVEEEAEGAVAEPTSQLLVGTDNTRMSDLLDEDSSMLVLDDAPLGAEPAVAEPAGPDDDVPRQGSDADFDADFDAAFDDDFDDLLDANAPEPVLTPEPEPEPEPEPQPESVPAAEPAAGAPPGGWPDLSDDLAEIRFFLDQGLDEDAEAALADLEGEHPGHPEIAVVRADLTGAQDPANESAGATPLVDLDGPPEADPAEPDEPDEPDEGADEDADEDAYLSAIFGGASDDAPSGSGSPRARKSGGKPGRVSAKAQDVAGASARDRFDLGMAYREMGLVDSAVSEFEAASDDPQWESRALVMLGTLRVLQGETDAAIADLERAADRASTDEERNSAQYELALVHEKTGNTAVATALLEGVSSGFRDRDDMLVQLRG